MYIYAINSSNKGEVLNNSQGKTLYANTISDKWKHNIDKIQNVPIVETNLRDIKHRDQRQYTLQSSFIANCY